MIKLNLPDFKQIINTGREHSLSALNILTNKGENNESCLNSKNNH